MKPLKGFEHYLSIEDANVSRSIELLNEDYQLVMDLDNLFDLCLKITLPDNPNLRVSAFLSLISHQEFYAGIAAFLRFHKTQSFRCLRSALDSTFTAYYLLKNPDASDIYLEKSRNPSRWEELFRNIKSTIKMNQKTFPLAAGLPEIHDLCSKFAHADPEGILHRYFMDKVEKRLGAHYFDYAQTHDEYRKWFAFFLFYFFKVFLIYWNEMFRTRAGRDKKAIEYLVRKYKTRIGEFRKKYPFR